MKADSVEKNLFWGRYGHADLAVFRIRIPGTSGRQIWQNIGRVSKDVARRVTREKRRQLQDQWALEASGLVKPPPAKTSSFGELFAAYDEFQKGVKLAASSARTNRNALALMVREVEGAADQLAVDKLSLDILCGAFVANFGAGRIRRKKLEAEAGKWGPEETARAIATAQTSICSFVHQARSLFSKKARASGAYAKLVFPAKLEEFMSYPLEGSTLKRYHRLSQELLDKVLQGVAALRGGPAPAGETAEHRRAMWLAAMLEANTGMRRGTAAEARWDWFLDHGEIDPDTKEALVTCHVGVAKGNLSEPVVFKSQFDEMQKARVDAGPYIVPGATTKERLRVLDDLKGYLRQLGLARRQPNHELRKIYLDTLRRRYGIDAALGASGHADPKTMDAYSDPKARAIRIV